MKRKALGTVLALAAGTMLIFAACHGSNNNSSDQSASSSLTGSAPITPDVPVAITGTGVCAGKPTWSTPDGTFQFCEKSTTFTKLGNRMQKVPDGGGTWTVTLGIISKGGGYLIDSTFGSSNNDGGAIGPVYSGGNCLNCGIGPYNMKPFPAGESELVITLTVGPGCGGMQEDIDAHSGSGQKISVFSVVFAWHNKCLACTDVKVQLGFCPEAGVAASTVAKCFKGGWVNPGSGSLNFGDSAVNAVINPFTASHQYAQTSSEQKFKATLTVTRDQLVCPVSVDVTIPPKTDPCDGVGTPAFTLNKTDSTNTSSVRSNLTYASGFAGNVSIDKTPASGFAGGPVNSGQNYDSVFNRPTSGGSALDGNYSWTVKKGEQVCKSGTKDVSIPPKTSVCTAAAASCNSVSVNTGDTTATVKTTCTWTPPPSVGQLHLPSYTTSINPGDMTPDDVVRGSTDYTYNASLGLSGETCATSSAIVKAKTCTPSYTWTGEFAIKELSNSGNGYYITDDEVNWLTGLNLAAGNNLLPTYPHDVDGSKLCLRWPTGTTYVYTFGNNDTHIVNACQNEGGTWVNGSKTCTTTHDHNTTWTVSWQTGNAHHTANGSLSNSTPTYEQIDCAFASCGDVAPSWHGKVKFECTRHNSCDTTVR